MIQINNLYKSFNTNHVLENLNITIEKGSIFGLVGINGAGKSTLLRIMAGIYRADRGEVLYNGNSVYENEDVKKDIFFLPDDPYYAINTTGNKLLALYKTFYSLDENIFKEYVDKFKLDINKPLNNFSKGMRRQMFISLAIACQPKYIFFDEAFDGLDPLARLTFKRSLIDIVEKNRATIIISSHSLRELEDICDTYGLLDNHQIISSGEIATEIQMIHKFQLAFSDNLDLEDFKNINVLKFEKTNRLIKLVLRGNKEELNKQLRAMNPLFIDEMTIDFEELFMYEVESKGYLK